MDQYWNAYSYCGADPVNYVDEWGLEGDENGDDDGDGTPNVDDQDQNPGSSSLTNAIGYDGMVTITAPNPGTVSTPVTPSPSGPGFDPDWLKKSFERQQAAYDNEGVEADPFIPSMMFGSLSFKAGKNIVKAGDDVVEDLFNAGKNFADDLNKARKGGPRNNLTEKPNKSKNDIQRDHAGDKHYKGKSKEWLDKRMKDIREKGKKYEFNDGSKAYVDERTKEVVIDDKFGRGSMYKMESKNAWQNIVDRHGGVTLPSTGTK